VVLPSSGIVQSLPTFRAALFRDSPDRLTPYQPGMAASTALLLGKDLHHVRHADERSVPRTSIIARCSYGGYPPTWGAAIFFAID